MDLKLRVCDLEWNLWEHGVCLKGVARSLTIDLKKGVKCFWRVAGIRLEACEASVAGGREKWLMEG